MASSIIPKALNGDISSLNDALAKHAVYESSYASNVALPASSFVDACTLTLPAGTWLVGAHVAFADITSATRRIAYLDPLSINESGIDIVSSGLLSATATAVCTRAATTYTLKCRSNTASSLAWAKMFAIGIAS